MEKMRNHIFIGMMANLNLFLFRKLQYLNVWVFFLKEAHPLQDHQHFLRLKWLLRNRKKAQSSKDSVLHKVIAKKKKKSENGFQCQPQSAEGW